MTRCFVGLGANLGNSLQTLCDAADALEALQDCSAAGRSRIYRSAPLGPAGQPDYLNAVLALQSALSPLALLDRLQALENRAGRERHEHWGPRTLDLDLLLYGSQRVNDERLIVPHPHMLERNFVLQPLTDIVGGDWQLPDGIALARHLANCPENPLQVTDFDWQSTTVEALNT